MENDEAILLTQDRLAEEGASMGELIGHFRNRISPALIGEREWERILDCADRLPISMGAQPFGFGLPLHDRRPEADFSVSLASGNRSGDFFEARARSDETDTTARAVSRLLGQMESGSSPLREVVGRKLMLEYDMDPAPGNGDSRPGMFLRPNERRLIAGGGRRNEVGLVVDALVSSVGWAGAGATRKNAERVYQAQPGETRLDSFGVFPSRSHAICLAVMGFRSQREIGSFLECIGWPGQISTVDAVISRFSKRASIVRIGANVDVQADGIDPSLGLTLVVKQRDTTDSRYWLDGLTDWDPFLEALSHEDIIVPEKLEALAGWVSKPSMLFARTGQFLMLRGIHHIKLVISGNQLQKAKAQVYMVLSGAPSP